MKLKYFQNLTTHQGLRICEVDTNCVNEPRSERRDLLAIKSKVRYLLRKKDLAVVNNYRKFEEIIFTNNKDMSV